MTTYRKANKSMIKLSRRAHTNHLIAKKMCRDGMLHEMIQFDMMTEFINDLDNVNKESKQLHGSFPAFH